MIANVTEVVSRLDENSNEIFVAHLTPKEAGPVFKVLAFVKANDKDLFEVGSEISIEIEGVETEFLGEGELKTSGEAAPEAGEVKSV